MTDTATATTRLTDAAGVLSAARRLGLTMTQDSAAALATEVNRERTDAALRAEAATLTPREQRAAARAEEVTPRQERAIARGLPILHTTIDLGPEPIASVDRVRPWGSAMSNADTAAGPGLETLDTWPTDDEDPVEAPSPVDRVIDDARSALALLEDRLDALLVRLAPALSDDTGDYDGQGMADPDTDPRSDLVKAIDGLGLTADRLATRVRLTTERLDL